MSESKKLEIRHNERDELLDVALAELTKNLSLITAELSEEKINSFTDLIRVQFMDIVKELDLLTSTHNEMEVSLQSERIRQWLSSLNRSAFVPITFRINCLKKIESYLDVIADDMGAQIVRAYKITVLHLKVKAQKNPKLYQEMVHVVGIAIELAVRNLQRAFLLHLVPSPTDIRQTLDMARLGLAIAQTLEQKEAADDIKKLKVAIISHELLRRIDTACLTDIEQNILYKRLYDFSCRGDVEYLAQGKVPLHADQGPYLISNIDKPYVKPRKSERLSNIESINALLIHMYKILNKANDALAENTPSDIEKSHEVLDIAEIHLEDDVRSFTLCGASILHSFEKAERAVRKDMQETGVLVSIRTAFSQLAGFDSTVSVGDYDQWRLVNISTGGAMLEGEYKAFPVGSMIEFNFSGELRYAIIRWFKATPQGVVQMGIEFNPWEKLPAKVTLANFASSDSKDKSWSSLLGISGEKKILWVGGWKGQPVSMTVSIKRDGMTSSICRIIPTGEAGANYAVFQVTQVLSKERPVSEFNTSLDKSMTELESEFHAQNDPHP